MKRIIATTISIVSLSSSALALFISSPAMAGDSWTGFYTGINAGYGTGEYTNSSSYFQPGHTEYYDNYISAVYPTVFGSGKSQSFVNGGVAGGQVGYNKQFANNIVIGIEGDMNWSNVFDRGQYSNSSGYQFTTSRFGDASMVGNNYSKTGLDWFGTVRGKFGYAFGNFMPYFTAGLAFGQISNVSNTTFNYGSYGAVGGGSASKTSAGWAMGAGAEYKLNDNWSVKGEYLYTNFNGPSSSSFAENGGRKSFSSSKITDFGVNHVRAGINYHFNLF
jgi:outer membrane immunogenic protein